MFDDMGRIAADLLPDFITQASEKGQKPRVSPVAGQNLKAVQDAGVLVASGTDAGNTGTLHGASYFRERSEEHTSELQSLMRISYAVFCLKKKKTCKCQTIQYKHWITNTTISKTCRPITEPHDI